MKNLNLKIAGTLTLSLLTVSTFAQINWQKGGNANVPFGAPSIIGTNATWNAPLNIVTNGINRLVMYNGGTANNAGQIAMGNNLPNNFVPQARLHLYQTGGFNSMRFTTDGTGHGANDGYQMGIGPNGDVAFINNEIDQNFSWYNQGSGPGNLLTSVRLIKLCQNALK